MNNWIPVTKRKPKSGKIVMVYTPQQTILKVNTLLGTYWGSSKDWTVYDFESCKEDYCITHWMSLPKTPY